jgi:hypothetical protein
LSPAKRKANMMSTINVELGLKPTIVLPQVIKIPVMLIRQLDLPRWVSITQANQVVPKPLRGWMLTHRDYKRWFAEGEEVVVSDVQSVIEIVDDTPSIEEVVSESESIDDLQPVVEKIEDTAPAVVQVKPQEIVAPWDEDFSDDTSPAIDQMNISELKEFAKANDIDISGKTIKADIQDAIYDALNAD